MTQNATAILTNPAPSGHIVYSYTTEAQLSDAVCLFASSGLHRGEAVILVMSDDHSGPIRQRLTWSGLDLGMFEAAGQLVCIGAERLLAQFVTDGEIDERRFRAVVGDVIEKAKSGSSRIGTRPVRVFGEMVNLLWGSCLTATTRIEELWNEVIAAHAVPLLCAYALGGARPVQLPGCLESLHSHAIG
jgi:hypothetical protein